MRHEAHQVIIQRTYLFCFLLSKQRKKNKIIKNNSFLSIHENIQCFLYNQHFYMFSFRAVKKKKTPTWFVKTKFSVITNELFDCLFPDRTWSATLNNLNKYSPLIYIYHVHYQDISDIMTFTILQNKAQYLPSQANFLMYFCECFRSSQFRF